MITLNIPKVETTSEVGGLTWYSCSGGTVWRTNVPAPRGVNGDHSPRYCVELPFRDFQDCEIYAIRINGFDLRDIHVCLVENKLTLVCPVEFLPAEDAKTMVLEIRVDNRPYQL
jgi:hypothetical protein